MVNEKIYYEKRIGVYILYISIHVKTERKFLDRCRKNCSLITSRENDWRNLGQGDLINLFTINHLTFLPHIGITFTLKIMWRMDCKEGKAEGLTAKRLFQLLKPKQW